MKRITKKILSVMLALVVVLGSVPFSVLSEISWFPFKITAFADDDSAGYPDYSELSENQYIARILLNYNYYGSATLGDATSGTVPNEQLKYWINPNDVSAARILRNELAGNSGFMASVGAWEVLTFDPSKTADEIFDEEDYYTAILTSILDVKMKDSEFKKAWNCSTNKTILDMSKSVTKFAKEILGTDISKAESVSISDFSPEQMDKLLNEIGELKSSQSFYDATGKNISVIKDATKACNTLYDLIKTISTYSQIANLNKATETVLKEIYDNAPQGTPMKAAAKKVYEICSEQMTQAMFSQIETGEALFNIGFEAVVGKLWDVALKGIFNMFGVDCGLLIGIKIGQAVGKTIANYCFSTDKTIEQYYVLDAVVQFEDVMVNTVNSLASKFKQGESVESADALVKAVELLFETYDLGCEYTFSFVETANSSGLVNKVRSWFKKDETVETYKRLTDSMKNTINNVKTTLTSLEGYKWYYEVDAPAAYKKCFEPEDSNPAYSKSKEITYINISATESGGAIFDFSVNEGKTVTIKNCNISASGEVSVPSEIGGFKVESISSNAFSNCESMISLKVGENIKKIEDNAFSGCVGLTLVELPNSVVYIGNNALSWCTGLISVKIPNSVTYIGCSAFEGCTKLKSIEIPESVTEIDNYAFRGCKNLSNVKMNRGLTTIGYGAFSGTAITSVKIPNTVISMRSDYGVSAFSGATKLNDVEFEYGILSIPDGALKDCSSVTNVVIPNGVTKIGGVAFYGCTGLTSIEIPNSVTYIGRSTFEGCTKLKSIEIPESVTEIDNYAFRGCKNLSNVKMNRGLTTIGYGAFSGTAITSVKIPNTVISMRSDYGVSAFSGATKLNDVEFEYGILSIPDGALQNCSSVTKAPIPDSVTRIGEFAFEGCSGLASVKIPDDVTCIGRYAFGCCTGFSSVEIPSGVTYIDQYAFNGCENLLDVTLNRGLERLGCGAFAGTSITSIKIPNTVIVMGTNNGKSVFSGAKELKSVEFEYGMLSIPDGALQNCSSVTKAPIPDSVTRIGEFAFEGCSGLASVKIPDDVTCIGRYAFGCCTGFSSVEIPSGVTYIDQYAFNGCENLLDVTLNRGLERLGCGAFAGTSITSIKIPNTVIVMGTNNGKSVFSGAKELKSVEFEYGMLSIPGGALQGCSSVTKVLIPNGIKRIGDFAFCWCENLTSIEMPDSLTYIDRYAFSNCKSLASVRIPDKVKNIGENAFELCLGLASVETPESVVEINNYAFNGCENLSDVKLNRGLKLIGRGAFFGTSITSIKIPNTVIAMGTNNGNSVFSGAKKLKSVEFEYGMLSIPSNALENCSDVTNVSIPDSATNIGNYAFCGCSGFTSVKIPDSVTNIENAAFYGCTGLTSIEIPDSVTYIGSYVFANCTGLTSIEIPDSVTNIGSNALYGCTALKTLNVVENSSAHKWAVKNGYSVSFIDCSHYYKDVVVESVSGCATRGYSYDICKTCGKKLQEYTVPEKGHSFTEATVITVPTCTAKGLKQSVCTKCGEKINTVLPLLEHQPERFGALKAPTCTEEGLQYGEKCSVCGEILKAQTVKPALGHRYGYDGICAVCGVDNAFEAESKHPYEASLDETKEIRRNGAVKVSVTFSEETKTEENCDYIYIYDKSNNLVGKYSGTQLSGKTVTVNGDTMKIRLVSDSDVNFFGYSIKKAEGIYGALIPAKDVLFDFDCNIIFTKQENVNTLDRLVTLNKSDEANSVTSIKSNNGSVFGSGSVICTFYDGVLDGVYTVALSGDLNGDGVCDVLDAMLCEKMLSGHMTAKVYQKYAANGGIADGIDISSYQRTVNEALK